MYLFKKLGPKHFSQKYRVQKFFGTTNFVVQQIFCIKKVKNVRYKNFFSQRNIWVKRRLFFKINVGQQKLRPQKIWSKNFGQNWVSNSWDYADMDKCCRDIHFMNKCHPYSWNLLKMVPGTYLLTFETFLIWTIGARTNVAWTNVPLTVGICSRCSQEPSLKISSKSGQ